MRRRLLGAGVAAAALAFSAAPASAELLVPTGILTEPGGVARTPDGNLWVADGLRGICQVDATGTTLVPSAYCQEEVEPPPGTPEPEIDPAPTAPAGAADLAFDAESNTFWAAEGTSGSSGVWRLDWNPLTGQITTAQRIVNTTPADERVFGLDLSRVDDPTNADPLVTRLEVDFVAKRTQLVRRITDATGPSPSVSAVGTAVDEEPADVARLDGKLYLAELTGVTVVEDPGGPVRDAIPVPTLGANIGGALIDDEAAGRLYVGTDNAAGADQVIAYEPGAPGGPRAEAYAGGLSGVSALNLDAGGAVLAADDPAIASGAVDAEGGGRVFRFAHVPLGLPRVILDQAPPVVGTATTVAFGWSSTRPDATFECSLDGAAWAACGDTGTGTLDVGPLLDGAHELAIRATDPTLGTGAAMRHVFTIDTGPPSVTIDNAESDRTVAGPSLDLRFTANEGGVSFDCSVDGAAAVPCSSPLRLRNLALGDHSVTVTGTDLVGQGSDPADPAATWAFKVVPAPPAPEPPKGDDNSGPGGGGGGGRDDRPTGIRPFTTSNSSSSCRSAITTRLNMRRPPAVLRVAFPGGFRPGYVRMAVTRKAKGGKKTVTVLSMHRQLETSNPCTKVAWGLWRSEGRKLKSGKYTLTVQAGRTRRTLRKVWSGSLRVVR